MLCYFAINLYLLLFFLKNAYKNKVKRIVSIVNLRYLIVYCEAYHKLGLHYRGTYVIISKTISNCVLHHELLDADKYACNQLDGYIHTQQSDSQKKTCEERTQKIMIISSSH